MSKNKYYSNGIITSYTLKLAANNVKKTDRNLEFTFSSKVNIGSVFNGHKSGYQDYSNKSIFFRKDLKVKAIPYSAKFVIQSTINNFDTLCEYTTYAYDEGTIMTVESNFKKSDGKYIVKNIYVHGESK